MDMQAAFKSAKRTASPCVRKEIDAMIRMTEGHSGKEIGVGLGVSAKLICAWVS